MKQIELFEELLIIQNFSKPKEPYVKNKFGVILKGTPKVPGMYYGCSYDNRYESKNTLKPETVITFTKFWNGYRWVQPFQQLLQKEHDVGWLDTEFPGYIKDLGQETWRRSPPPSQGIYLATNSDLAKGKYIRSWDGIEWSNRQFSGPNLQDMDEPKDGQNNTAMVWKSLDKYDREKLLLLMENNL